MQRSPGRLVLAVLCLVAVAGCRKVASPSSAAGEPDAGQAAAAEPAADAGSAAPEPKAAFAIAEVQGAPGPDGIVVSFLVANQGPRRAVAVPCVEGRDGRGELVTAAGGTALSLKAGDADRIEANLRVPARVHEQIRSFVVYVAGRSSCSRGTAVSPVLHLGRDGKTEPPVPEWEDRPSGAETLRLSAVRIIEEGGETWVRYRVTNSGQHRMGATLCVRVLSGTRNCDCKSVPSSPAEEFSLGPGASLQATDAISFLDQERQAASGPYQVYAARYGCADSPEEALSNVVSLERTRPPEAGSEEKSEEKSGEHAEAEPEESEGD